MANNIIISGAEGDSTGELCAETAIDFLKTKMKMHLLDAEVHSAYRKGVKLGKKPRPLVVKCSSSLHKRVFTYTKNLHGIKNAFNDLLC